MRVWLIRIGVAAAIVSAVLLFWRSLLTLVAALALLVAGAYVGDRWRKWRVVRRFRAVWGRQGKDLLVVYSNSPHWQRYVEESWLPRWGHRAVVLNWSERRTWRSVRTEVALFRAFAGRREFNPLAIVVPTRGSQVHVVRFWRPFRELKHGKERELLSAEAALDRCLPRTIEDDPVLQQPDGERRPPSR